MVQPQSQSPPTYDECSENNLVFLEVNYPIDTVFRREALLREVEKDLYHTSGNVEPCTGEASMNFTGCVHKSKSEIDFMLPARAEPRFRKL